MKYIIAAGLSLIVSIAAMIMGNFLSGILIFVLLFGGYILFNVVKGIEKETPQKNQPTNNQE
ncbi:MAG: hypothetical protein RBS01_04015 [Candidatus Dojkabacteria bacterium]|jgi:hypothetical protein|nr:hypothetical protein [Candidatus Dojkabacteria bacterium]